MATKEEEFKVRFAAIMADIGETGRKDSEAMLLIGSLASTMIDAVGRKSWKQSLGSIAYCARWATYPSLEIPFR